MNINSHTTLFIAALIAVSTAPFEAQPPAPQTTPAQPPTAPVQRMAIVGGDVWTVTNGVIRGGTVLVKDGKIEQVGGMTFVGWGIVTAQQNASRIGACQRLCELSFELCRRLRWKLQIEPAPRLDFSHDHGLPPPPSR